MLKKLRSPGYFYKPVGYLKNVCIKQSNARQMNSVQNIPIGIWKCKTVKLLEIQIRMVSACSFHFS